MNEVEILEKGFEKVAENLYIKDNKLFIQHRGSILEASKLTRDELQNVASLVAYDHFYSTSSAVFAPPPIKSDMITECKKLGG